MMNTDQTVIRTYSELITFPTFLERYEYLKLSGHVALETFGAERYLNQEFYHSKLWRSIRDKVIARDLGCDLGVDGRELYGRITIHHMNPMMTEDFQRFTRKMVDPEYLICCSHNTHMAIHYGDSSLLFGDPVERSRDDTCPWKRSNV